MSSGERAERQASLFAEAISSLYTAIHGAKQRPTATAYLMLTLVERQMAFQTCWQLLVRRMVLLRSETLSSLYSTAIPHH